MLNQSVGEEDIALAVDSRQSCVPWRVTEAHALDNFRLTIRFQDGLSGTIDLSQLILSPQAGVFARLSDPLEFAQLFVENGAVTWPGELDLAPDGMYEQVKRQGI